MVAESEGADFLAVKRAFKQNYSFAKEWIQLRVEPFSLNLFCNQVMAGFLESSRTLRWELFFT